MRILVVDDDDTLRLMARMTLEERQYQVEEAEDGESAVAAVERTPDYDVVLLDVNMPGISGLEALTRIKEINPQICCIILTAYSDVKDAVVAIKSGAYDYLEKPVEAERLLALVDRSTAANELVRAAAFSAPQVQFAEGQTMIGGSSEIRKVFDVIYKLSKVDTSVLIRGESGTGKELVAQAIHFNSHRKKGPFVAVNCAAVPENLIESELFGHEKGAFTGADKKKAGRFQYAEGGTLFLDEIGDISAAMQVKLLRVLQERRFTPVGANVEIPVDTRIIAATNRPLEKMIEEEKFRSDLFYRLNVLPIKLPPLRERQEDIASLAEFMVTKFNKRHSRQVTGLEPEALQALRSYAWPGNIRELENVIEHAFILESANTIGLASLPETLGAAVGGAKAAQVLPATTTGTGQNGGGHELNYPALKERFEREFIIRALKTFDGRINQTAAQTKMTKVTLLRKLEKYGINPREFRP